MVSTIFHIEATRKSIARQCEEKTSEWRKRSFKRLTACHRSLYRGHLLSASTLSHCQRFSKWRQILKILDNFSRTFAEIFNSFEKNYVWNKNVNARSTQLPICKRFLSNVHFAIFILISSKFDLVKNYISRFFSFLQRMSVSERNIRSFQGEMGS